jgi:hypothetical protein
LERETREYIAPAAENEWAFSFICTSGFAVTKVVDPFRLSR